jgi:hypothetical protein
MSNEERRGRSDIWTRNDPDLISSAQFYLITAPNRSDLYWRPNRQGYTIQIAEAGVYSKREAEGIVSNGRGDMMIPLHSLANTVDYLVKKCDEDKKALLEMVQMIKEDTK